MFNQIDGVTWCRLNDSAEPNVDSLNDIHQHPFVFINTSNNVVEMAFI